MGGLSARGAKGRASGTQLPRKLEASASTKVLTRMLLNVGNYLGVKTCELALLATGAETASP